MPLIAYSPADVEVTFLLTRKSLIGRNSLRAIDPASGAEGRSLGRWIRQLALPIAAGWAAFALLAFVVSGLVVGPQPDGEFACVLIHECGQDPVADLPDDIGLFPAPDRHYYPH